MKRILGNLLLAVCASLAGFLLVLAADRFVGWKNRGEKVELALLFPPHADVEYDTLEFNCKVHTNNLGFRGDDTTLHKTHEIRIAVFGDSYTYGWGVSLEDSWVKRLEAMLRDGGHDVEILNLGVPGTWPGRYADCAEEIVPVLRPDIVLVGLLAADDLEQGDTKTPTNRRPAESAGGHVAAESRLVGRSLSHRLFPNLTGVAKRELLALTEGLESESAKRWRVVSRQWTDQARKFVARLNPEELGRFHRLPKRVQDGLLEGKLNPGNLQWMFPRVRPIGSTATATWPADGGISDDSGPAVLSTADPSEAGVLSVDATAIPEFNLNSPLMQRRIKVCAEQIARIRAVSETHGAQTIVISIPDTSRVALNAWRSEIQESAPALVRKKWAEELVSSVPDEAARKACEIAGVPMIEVTAEFRERARKIDFFYPLDTHYTPAGNRLLAELLTPRLGAYLN